MDKVIASLESFDKTFPKLPKKGERKDALKEYFSSGGVIKAYDIGGKWPKLTYPSYLVLDRKIKELRDKKKIYSGKLGDWRLKYASASLYHQIQQLKKLKEPLYWQHMAKVLSDSDYKKDAEKVKLPAHLVGDDRWKPMVKMFVTDLDYRKQLTETVSTSIAYRKNKKVARYADDLQGFRMAASQKEIDSLEKKVLEIEKTEKALKEIQRWARE
ncbi:MAG: hypothetical protein NTZ73_02380 [Candidatus Diapherotrites archaeon]|nr:hypothetical protein [Candidatus Diapherotrites archaeon]